MKFALCEPQKVSRLDLGEEDLGKEQLMFTNTVAVAIVTEFIYYRLKKEDVEGDEPEFPTPCRTGLGMEQKARGFGGKPPLS